MPKYSVTMEPPLAGAPGLRIVIDEREIARIAAGIDGAVARRAQDVVRQAATAAVKYLGGLDGGSGHAFLARQWTFDGPHVDAGGRVWAEVYSKAEEMEFDHRNWSGQVNKAWSIGGVRLLNILEEGASQHEIVPYAAKNLYFRAELGARSSMFRGAIRAGIARTRGRDPKRSGVVAFSYVNPDSEQDEVITGRVDHPGVTGNHHVKMTRDMVEARIEEIGRAALFNISVEDVPAARSSFPSEE